MEAKHNFMHAVVDVGNGMLQRKWKHPDKDSEAYDLDTLPMIHNILANVNLVEAETLSNVVDKISKAKEAGRIITAAIDSTQRSSQHRGSALVETPPSPCLSSPSVASLPGMWPTRWQWVWRSWPL